MENRVIPLVEHNPDDKALTLRAFKKSNILNEVIVTRDGVEGLDYLFGEGVRQGRDTTIQPVRILLDLNLPKIDSLEVLRCLCADGPTKLLPLVILTSSSEEQELIMGYSCGASSYVRKPMDFVQFYEAVRRLGVYRLVLNVSPSLGRDT